MKYCLDANFFITAWHQYYAPEILEDFWSWLTKLAVDKEIFITTEVYEEIEVGKDGLYGWLKNIKDKIVVPMDGKTQEILVQIMRDKPEARNIADSNKKDNKADIFVVASAKRNNSTVVTNDKKLCDLCKICDVKCLKDYEFLKEKKLKMSISK